jgi:hypothetical protein
MSYNSKQFLANREALANGIEPITGKGYHRAQQTSMSDRNAWLAGLTDADREQLRVEAEYEQSKNEYRYD